MSNSKWECQSGKQNIEKSKWEIECKKFNFENLKIEILKLETQN